MIVYGGKLIAAARVWWCVEVVFYCGGGWRSSVAFFYAWLLGFENVRNYSDGWSGWSTEYHPDPVALGRTPGWRQQPSRNPIEAGAP